MTEQLSAAERYRRSIHYRTATVFYEDDDSPASVRNMYFFHTEGWSDADVIADIERRHPSWRNVSLGLQATYTPARDAPLPKRNRDLEAAIAQGER